MNTTAEGIGLTTVEALQKLHLEITTVLNQYQRSQNKSKAKLWIKDALCIKSQHTTLNLISLLFGICTVVSLICAHLLDIDNISGYETIPISVLLIINVSLEIYDNKLRHNEILNRVKSILERLLSELPNIKWNPEHYPDLCSPFSPCITSQWVYRDNKLVNIPWALLVKGDIILIRPGQPSPGYCEALDKHSEYPLLHAKEIYAPQIHSANEIFSTPKSRRPVEPKPYRLLETPYLNNLRIYIEQSLDRPITLLNQQRHLVMIKLIERVILPVTFVLIVSMNLFRFFYFHEYIGNYLLSNMLFIVPANIILPLLPLVFPLFWNITNYFGIARFKTIFDATTKCEAKDNLLEEDGDNTTIDQIELRISETEILKNFLDIIKGQPKLLIRSTNILHVLGSVTALGCVDKKGILSWPNPTAEKVFFLHNQVNESASSSSASDDGSPPYDCYVSPSRNAESPGGGAIVEVLDLTHDHADPFKLRFDDHDWSRYLSSLKPLGLAILLNTCNVETQEKYAAFCSHITCEAIFNENLVPVTNRRCLCEVAKEIGFVDQAQKIFSLESQLSTFRHLQPEMVKRDNKYVRSLQMSTKLKFPFPHMFAVIVRELSTGNSQLLSEGTADIILDSCIDYWDGYDLVPLTHGDRKKIQDFYQRSSLTAYCTAFAYRPLSKTISNSLSDLYLELPSDSRHLYTSLRSPTPAHWDCVLEPKIRSTQFFSTDSLLYNDCPAGNLTDAESCFQMQCNQIFIGMVTMQYQVLTDMVQLIEQLERACIRFVHFSKENELRSRVFSEKMGLESGWNCHISLLSERTSNLESSRTMSFSAPSAINMEHTVVKFDTEVERFITDGSENRNSIDESATPHDWQSLSNLTESTEQSAPINFDMSNRAKLPRGIDKIRPHIELIDNVPLLVSLFTDCTPSATREMLHIMQDYKEVVCILGSSENCDNAGTFMQADASIAVKPLYPQVCQKRAVYEKTKDCISPIELSCMLNTVPCALSFKREDPLCLHRLIMEARHFVAVIWNSVQFWLCCCVALSVLQTIAALFMLPGLLTTWQVLWFSCIVIPAISISFMAKPLDMDVMKKPQGKIQTVINWDGAIFVIWCYGSKFLLTFIVVTASYIGILSNHCEKMCILLPNCTCAFLFHPIILNDSMPTEGWDENKWTLLVSRLIVCFIILLHFVMISTGFIHRDHLIFQKPSHTNLYWLGTVFTLIAIQCVYTIIVLMVVKDKEHDQKYDVPLWVIIFGALSPLGVLFISEIVKKQEIKVNKRFLKRARLDFGTKLGMNSPF
ncbi:unnamed protein product [Callosobruchus maculatus]|uniref:Cation-transporting P-type ATPase C-terminal domain-containing protein n=1 Tax=Callosobruchus maculatus TaxID=64391 RepID=A0A653CHU3_CALMS|nr:unnamed protein product [Callosobruchus maculatus]